MFLINIRLTFTQRVLPCFNHFADNLKVVHYCMGLQQVTWEKTK